MQHFFKQVAVFLGYFPLPEILALGVLGGDVSELARRLVVH